MNTKTFAFPQPSFLSKANLYQESSSINRVEPHDHPINASIHLTNKPSKSLSVPMFQSRPHFTTVLLNKTSKAGPELTLDIQHLGGGSKRPVANMTPDPPFENIGVPKAPSRGVNHQSRGQSSNRGGSLVSLPNLNLTMTSVNHCPPTTVFEMFKNLMDPLNEIRGIEGVKLKEKEKEVAVSKSISSHRPLTRKNTQTILETSTSCTSKKVEELETRPIKLQMKPLVLHETFRKEHGGQSNKLTKRSNTGSLSGDEDDDSELQTAQIFSHHMEEKPKICLIDNLHFRKNIRKIFKSQGAKESHRSIDEQPQTNKYELKRGVSNSHNNLNSTATDSQDSIQGWNCIRPVRIVSGKSVRSDSHQPMKQNFAIKTYQNGVFRSQKKSVVKCVTEFDVKIAKIFKKDRTLEQNILSPLNESSSSEDDNFAEYVEAVKSENILRCL